MITKQRTAMNREYNCAECSAIIVKGSKYFDSDEKIGNKPFPTRKYCISCGEKLVK